MTTTLERDWILEELYVIMHEGVFGHGWINADELLHEMTHKQSYDSPVFDEYAFSYAEPNDVLRTFKELQRQGLVKQNRGLPDLWRIDPLFYASLDEWCECVMEALESDPSWHDTGALGHLVAKVSRLHMDTVTCRTILRHLRETRSVAIEFGTTGYIKIRLLEWLKRCQTPAHSL